jgi:hypothetical protein
MRRWVEIEGRFVMCGGGDGMVVVVVVMILSER